ncbi:MAG TPA: NBR1-Ig-like domain-containing protein [Anaerolineales bacterium]
MSRLIKLTWLVMALILLGLAACGGGTPTTDPSLAYTQIWQTVEVAQTQTALSASPTPSLTDTPTVNPNPGVTSSPTITHTPLPGTPSVTPFTISTPAGTLSAAACDNAIGVADVTYPDGSEVVAGAPFVKTWQVKNIGPCSWNQNYVLVFGWGGIGTNWNTTPPSHFTAIVLPGETLDISVTLTAPTTPGTYGASFALQNDKGYNFGPVQTVVVVVK